MKKITHNPFLIPFTIMAIILIIADSSIAFASNLNDCDIVKKYIKDNYPNCEVVFLNQYDEEIIEHRKDTNIVYVEKFISYSKGNYGYNKDNIYVKYNTEVAKGEKVISYFIYNPYTNYCDDVVAVVDNHEIR